MSDLSDLEELLSCALLSAEHLIGKSGNLFYEEAMYQGVPVPLLNIQSFKTQIMGLLIDKGRLNEDIRLRVDSFAFQNEILGVVRYDLKNIRITTASHLNTCWHRFVFCKELCQMYVDTDQNTKDFPVSEIDSQVYDLIRLHKETIEDFDLFSIKPSDKNYSEFLAFFMAVNLVFPEYHRKGFKILQDLLDQEDTSITLYDIAYIYRMPEFVLRFFIKKIFPYYARFKSL